MTAKLFITECIGCWKCSGCMAPPTPPLGDSRIDPTVALVHWGGWPAVGGGRSPRTPRRISDLAEAQTALHIRTPPQESGIVLSCE